MSDPHSVDPIEAEMAAGSTVLHREKLVGRSLALVCAAMFVTFTGASIAYALGWAPNTSVFMRVLTLAMVLLSLFVGLTATVLRTLVTTHEVHLSRGPTARRIPLGSITACEVVPFGKPYGAVELFAPTFGKEGVLVTFSDAAGVPRKALIASDDAPRLAAAVARARGAGVRVAASEAVAKEPELDASEQSTEAARASAGAHTGT